MTTQNPKRNTENYKGNTNAMKRKQLATAQVQIRTTPDRKFRYVRQAEREGLRLTEWMTKHLDDVCDKAGTYHTDAFYQQRKSDDPNDD